MYIHVENHNSLGHDSLGHNSLGHNSLGHNSLGHEQPSGLDVKQSPNAQDTHFGQYHTYMYLTELELPCPSGERLPLLYINFKDSACPAELPWWRASA